MANSATKFFEFYRRYRWRAQDFELFQESMVAQQRALSEGAIGAAVLSGFELSPAGGMILDIAPGIAEGASGQLLIISDAGGVTGSAPLVSPRKDLIVARPLLEATDYITNPTSPFEEVPLTIEQQCELVLIEGTPGAEPEYPAKEDNDVILAGLKLVPGQVSISANDLDYEAREFVGRNSGLRQRSFHHDDRLMPYRDSAKVLGIKPSQTVAPKLFIDTGDGRPSIFPKDGGGLFNYLDTLLDFETGVISGGDAQSGDFTPTIPTAANSIVATVSIVNDELVVQYGIQGTLAQCLAGIANQAIVGAGSIAAAVGSYKIAYVVISSFGGAISDLLVIDARSAGPVVAAASTGFTPVSVDSGDTPFALADSDSGKIFLVDTSGGPFQFDLPAAPSTGFTIGVKDTTGDAPDNPITMNRNGSEEIEGLAVDYLCEAAFGAWTFIFDGTDYWLI